MKCKHCKRELQQHRLLKGGYTYTHADGRQKSLHRCDPNDSGLAYGYEAEPEGVPCGMACLGSVEKRFHEALDLEGG